MSLSHPLLTRRPFRDAPALDLGAGARLPLGRLHEACGDARHMLALAIAARAFADVSAEVPLYWIAPSWVTDRLNADGMAACLDPARVIFAGANRAEDILWTLEEVLRSGATPMAVADLPELPGLTAIRRLHLAAETGGKDGRFLPLGLILTSGDGGAPGVETRWHISADHAPRLKGWRLDRRRARTDPPRAWTLRSGTGGPQFHDLRQPAPA